MNSIESRKGIIRVSERVFREILGNKALRDEFCKNIVVSKAEFIYTENLFEYHCYSPLFEELTLPGIVIPRYEIVVNQTSEKLYKISAIKC